MMGKRVNYAARSVISPDPNIEPSESLDEELKIGCSLGLFVGYVTYALLICVTVEYCRFIAL